MNNNEPVAWMDKETGQVSRVACYDIPLYSEAFVRQQQAEIEALKWEVNHREQDVDALKTKLNDVKYKYDIKIHQHVYTQVYVDELQAEIEALKKEKWLTEIDCKQQVLKQIIDMLTIHHDTLACISYPMSKENRVKKLQEEYAKVFENHWSEQQ